MLNFQFEKKIKKNLLDLFIALNFQFFSGCLVSDFFVLKCVEVYFSFDEFSAFQI